MFKKAWKYYAVAIVVVVLDQILKLWVYWNMQMGAWGQIKVIGNWFKLHYTLNPGMAFGIQFGFSYDKILLTVIRIVATLFIIRYIWRLTRTAHTQKHSPLGFADASSTSADAASQKHLMHQSCFSCQSLLFDIPVIFLFSLSLFFGSQTYFYLNIVDS